MLRMLVCTYIYTLTPCYLFPSSLLRIHFGPRLMIPSTNFVQAASSFIAAEAGSKLGMHSLGDRQLSFTSNVNGRLMVGSYSPAIQHGESPFLGKSTKWWKGKPGCWWRVWDRLFCGKFAISILSPLKRPALILGPLSEVPFMWKDGLISFRALNSPRKEQDARLTNRALMFNSEAMISTGCRSRSGGKTLHTCWEWRFERRSAGGWCPVALGVLWLVDSVGTVLFTGGILLFVLLKKIQLYRIPSTLITKHPVLLSSKSQTIWFCLKTGHPQIWWFINIMVHQCVSWFIRKCPFSSGYLRVIPFWEKSI